MADHVREVHGGNWTKDKPWEDWDFTLNESHRKPLDRQLSEFINIRKAKTLGSIIIDGKETKISKELYNTKDEWFSHVNSWDTI